MTYEEYKSKKDELCKKLFVEYGNAEAMTKIIRESIKLDEAFPEFCKQAEDELIQEIHDRQEEIQKRINELA